MSGYNIGIGVGLRYIQRGVLGVKTPEQKYSCFGTGQWVMKYPWINDDLWKMEK